MTHTCTVTCSAPGCGASHTLTSDYVAPDGRAVEKAIRELGWWSEHISWREEMHVCPEHKDEVIAASKAAHVWGKELCAELNKVRAKHKRKRPKLLPWLKPLLDSVEQAPSS